MTRAPAPPLVLVVDDEPIIRQLLADALTDLGYLVETAAHGAEALEKVARQTFHAILLDLMMPVMDGREFLRHIRGHAAPPVLVLSAAAPDQLSSALDLGAAGCISKPFDLDAVVAQLRGILGDVSQQT